MRIPMIAALTAALLVPGVAGAQSYGEVRHDRRELARDQQDLRDAQRYGDLGDVRHARRELREDRHEAREDWRGYRRDHRDLYHRGAYVGPRGYRYRPVAVGSRFDPVFYGRRYWINDPWTYRLRRPTGYQRWVRYGNDVVLVDTRRGRVIEVNNGFLW